MRTRIARLAMVLVVPAAGLVTMVNPLHASATGFPAGTQQWVENGV